MAIDEKGVVAILTFYRNIDGEIRLYRDIVKELESCLALKRATDEALEELADFDGLLAEMEEGTLDGGTGESGI